MSMEPLESLLTIAETAKRLHVSRRYVDFLIAERRLTVCRIVRKCVRIRPDDLRAYLDSVTERAETVPGAAYREEKTICPTDEKIRPIGGSITRTPAAIELDALLDSVNINAPPPWSPGQKRKPTV